MPDREPKPILAQYGAYLGRLVRGDLGVSFRYNTPVRREIGARLGRTAQLALAATAVALVIAIPLGVIELSGSRRRTCSRRRISRSSRAWRPPF